jgi:two-component system sensor histidine kinase MtrB
MSELIGEPGLDAPGRAGDGPELLPAAAGGGRGADRKPGSGAVDRLRAMRLPGPRWARRRVRIMIETVADAAERAGDRLHGLARLWRRSLQLRVVVSTLALSSAVLVVLGLVLQTQITNGLLQSKRSAAVEQTLNAALVVERELVSVDPGYEQLDSRLTSALTSLNSQVGTGSDTAAADAGTYTAVLADGRGPLIDGQPRAQGPLSWVPPKLRLAAENNRVATQITTVTDAKGRTTFTAVGLPVSTAGRNLQLYLLFPLSTEQQTLGLVRNTLLVGGLVLTLLLAGIAGLVTRQVVSPVRQAAAVAERLADGHLDERMPVVGEDDVATLAQAFNEMAASLYSQIRQLEEFGALQRRFTSDVSHELRTPLTTVRMAADVLHASREEFPAGLARSSELLVDELDRFELLLNQLLEISRLDAGVADLAVEPIDARGVVGRAVDSVLPLAGRGGVDLRVYQPGEPLLTELDAGRVERIVRNLLANALDHAEGKPVVVRVAGDHQAVAVLVRDFGVGLKPGEADLVFNRFWRADPSRNRRTGGTGLGLSISLEDARLHGGRLEAWGEPGRGAAFRLTLPRVSGEPLVGSPLPLWDGDTALAAVSGAAPGPVRALPAATWSGSDEPDTAAGSATAGDGDRSRDADWSGDGGPGGSAADGEVGG